MAILSCKSDQYSTCDDAQTPKAIMPPAKELSQMNIYEARCPVNYRTQQIPAICDQYSISKMVQKTSHKSKTGEIIINNDLITEALRKASRNNSSNDKLEIHEVMCPLLETSEDEGVDLSADNDSGKESEPAKDFPDSELEPVRFSVYSVRRRSIQYLPVQENTSDKGSGDLNLPTPPVFNLGRSLKNLYCKEEDNQQEENETTDSIDTEAKEEKFDLTSKSALLRKVKVYKPLQRNHSLPELSEYTSEMSNIDNGFDGLTHSNSITNLTRNWKQANLEMEKSPGYAFLASVAENLRGKQAKTMVLRSEMGVNKADRKLGAEVNVSDAMNSKVTIDKPRKDELKEIPKTVSPVNIAKEEPKQSVFASVYNWGTKSKTLVSNKEMNMYSPMSF